jgi:Iron-sulfur cluster-binding domain
VGKPFIAVKLPVDSRVADVLICNSQNDNAEFAQKLSYVGFQFLDGLRLLLLDDIYDAAFKFFDWLEAPSTESVLISEDEEAHFCFDFRRVELESGHTRAAKLETLFSLLEESTGNNRTRQRFLETLAFSLSRFYGQIGEYDLAISYVDRAIQSGDGFMHLKACRHALDLKKRGMPIPERLAKFVGRDTGMLMQHVCTLPFTRFEVNPTGRVHVCCPMWVPESIGDIEQSDTDEILNGERALRIRKSVIDGSFKYCSHLGCPAMLSGKLPKKNSPEILSDPLMSIVVRDRKLSVDHLRFLKFGYDKSCNLSCPSCRRDLHVEPRDIRKGKTIAEKFLPLLPSLEELFLNSAGEFLVSRHSRQLLQSIDAKKNPHLKINIISNGTLLSKREWDKFENIHPLVRSIRISMDAAFPRTFEQVRRGGKWNEFFENICFVAQLRRDGRISRLTFAFTYQDRNYLEMKEFVELCRKLGADRAVFERIHKTDAMSDEEYAERAVHLLVHPKFNEFIRLVRDPIFSNSDVLTDFDYAFPVDPVCNDGLQARATLIRSFSCFLLACAKLRIGWLRDNLVQACRLISYFVPAHR